MSSPEQGRHAEEATPAKPTVSTSPAVPPQHRWWSSIPSHLGRARTSTVVMGVLFLAIFFLYLEVKPPVQGADPASGNTGVEEPQAPTAPTTTEPPATTEPEPTEAETETTTPTRTQAPTTESPAPTTEPEPETETEPTTGRGVPAPTTTQDSPGGASSPTTVSPPR